MNSTMRQLFFFVVVLAVPVASYFLLFKPQNEEIARARNEIELKESMLNKLRAATDRTADLEQANAEIEQGLHTMQARLPSSKEMDDVLRQVSSLATGNDLVIPEFRKSERPLPAGLAMEQPIDIKITGNFDGFYTFLTELEKMPRLTRIPNMKIKRGDEFDGQLNAELVLSIYYENKGS